jgi:hypothetical protein
MSTKNIQRVELDCYHQPIFCPACGQRVITGTDANITPCSHTLFIAHDEGFEYRSAAFDKEMGIEGISSDALELGEAGYDGFTNEVPIKNAVKFATYVPAPSFFGGYVGFSFSQD